MRWIVELGRIDIHHKVALLSQYLASLKVGHMEQAIHILKYLDIHKSKFISFDPTRLEISEPLNNMESIIFKRQDMLEFYPYTAEDKLQSASEPRGEPVQLNVFVDSNYTGNIC